MTINILMSIFSFCILQIPVGFIGIAFQKNSEQVIIIYEILTILIVSTLFYYFQFVRYSYG